MNFSFQRYNIDIIANGLKPVNDKSKDNKFFFLCELAVFASATKDARTASRERKN